MIYLATSFAGAVMALSVLIGAKIYALAPYSNWFSVALAFCILLSVLSFGAFLFLNPPREQSRDGMGGAGPHRPRRLTQIRRTLAPVPRGSREARSD